MAGCSKDPRYTEDEPVIQFMEPRKNTSDCMEEDAEDDISKNTSDYMEEDPEDDIRIQECADRIREKLVMSAQMDKLSELLDIRLSESGWKSDLLNIVKAEIRKKKDLKLEELYDLVKEKGKRLVPLPVQKEMVRKIQKSYEMVKDDFDDESI